MVPLPDANITPPSIKPQVSGTTLPQAQQQEVTALGLVEIWAIVQLYRRWSPVGKALAQELWDLKVKYEPSGRQFLSEVKDAFK